MTAIRLDSKSDPAAEGRNGSTQLTLSEETHMPESGDSTTPRRSSFVESLSAFSRQHRAQHWEGTFGDFLTHILQIGRAHV